MLGNLYACHILLQVKNYIKTLSVKLCIKCGQNLYSKGCFLNYAYLSVRVPFLIIVNSG